MHEVTAAIEERAKETGKPSKDPVREALARTSKGVPYRRSYQKIGRNEPCPCRSGRKFKKCCGR